MIYQTYRNLPPLAGLCSMEEAQRIGLSVEECVRRLKRFHYAFKRLHEIFTARITAEPIYELKTAFSHHAYLCAEHTAAIRKRVGEMREPPLGLEDVPDPALELYFNEILCAPTTEALVFGLLAKAIPALREAVEQYIRDTHKLADAPSIRLARFALLELEDIEQFGRQAVASLVDRAKLNDWSMLLDECLAAAGGLDGVGQIGPKSQGPSPRSDEAVSGQPSAISLTNRLPIRPPIAGSRRPTPEPHFSAQPYHYDRVPKRDERFSDSYNAGVNPEAFLYDEQFSPRDKTLMMYYKRLREIDVPEMMASIIAETPGKPWGYYLEMSRQLWDEARHAMMGEVGFVHSGIDWTKIPINFTWSLNLNTQLTPIERHAVLYFIEQGLMPRTGKRYEWEVGTQSGDALSGLFQDFDWADEVLHARIGRDWYVKDFANLKESLDYGDRCWTKVVSHWRKYLEDGLTQHLNWWPEVYQAACQHWGVAPDPVALAFNTTYENQRADLKLLSASG
jgi:hypothetical protein